MTQKVRRVSDERSIGVIGAFSVGIRVRVGEGDGKGVPLGRKDGTIVVGLKEGDGDGACVDGVMVG